MTLQRYRDASKVILKAEEVNAAEEESRASIASIMKELALLNSHLKRCVLCGGPGSAVQPLKKCAQCRRVRYCNGDCQRKHWAKHAPTCSATH